jgi:AcrR family transcriptional regulator
MKTKEDILQSTIPILAREGYAGTSMRKIATAIGREPSTIYVHFTDKDHLLRETRLYIIKYLDQAQHYSEEATASQLLRETLHFQFNNREMIVALLQYFMAAKDNFAQVASSSGYIPEKAYEHMARVIRLGIDEGVYHSENIGFDAKTSTHLVNGFLMEYYDRDMTEDELERVIGLLHVFIERALNKEERGGGAQ